MKDNFCANAASRTLAPLSAATRERLGQRLETIESLLVETATKSDVRRIERRIDKAEQAILGEIRAQRPR